MKRIWLLLLLLAIVFVVSGCIRQTTTISSEQVQPTGEIKEFEITAKQFSFEPSVITVNKGDTVKLKITSVDVTHGFAINEFNINERIERGKIVNVEFIADKIGTFPFYCSIVCGTGHSGMRGELIVK
ncbi:cupredoxin domain-containing protein [Candidatus Woesearchaeota archaeon]|nr:cupredoxin domain-containing protein [Candidatus Woesearchaeota archaeon]